MTLREMAYRLRGEVAGAQVLCPGPNHEPHDRSLSVKISPSSPDGFLTHSFAGDDFKACRDYVRERLGLPRQRDNVTGDSYSRPETSRRREVLSDDRRQRLVCGCWEESIDVRGTIAEVYLRGRGLKVETFHLADVVRFHPSCAWREGDKTIRVPALVAAMRAIVTDEIFAVHRSRLTPDGRKVDRRMLGVADGAAIKLDADETVTYGLAIGEGVETCLAARQFGIRPAWALGSKGAIAKFPVLSGIETLTILAEPDAAREIDECARRWHDARREVRINRSLIGKDLADAIRGAA
jgi:hypothetical protein